MMRNPVGFYQWKQRAGITGAIALLLWGSAESARAVEETDAAQAPIVIAQSPSAPEVDSFVGSSAATPSSRPSSLPRFPVPSDPTLEPAASMPPSSSPIAPLSSDEVNSSLAQEPAAPIAPAPIAEAAPAPAPIPAPRAAEPTLTPTAPISSEAATQLKPSTTLTQATPDPSPIWDDSAFLQSLGSDNGVLALDMTNNTGVPDIAEPLMINEAVAFALKNNFETQAAAANRKSAYWDKMSAYALYGPAVDIKLSKGRETSAPGSYNDSSGSRISKDEHSRRDHIYAIRQPIIDLAVIQDILAAADKENLAEETQRDAREGIAYDTVNVYMKLIQASTAIRLAEQYKGYLDELAKRMQARVEGGGATAGDLDRIRGRATLAESARIEAIGEYETNLAEFKRLTQVTPGRLLIPQKLAPVVPPDVDVAVERANVANPSYLGSLRKVDLAKSTRDRSYAGLVPKVSLEYSNTYAYNAGGAAKGNPVDGSYPTQDDKRLLLVGHWAFNGGNEITTALAGTEKIREARYRSQDTRLRIEQAVKSSYNAINAANQRIEVLQKGVDANGRVVKEFEDQYGNGRRSLFELLDAHEQLYSSRLNLMRITVARAQASYLVRRQMGDLVPTLIGTAGTGVN